MGRQSVGSVDPFVYLFCSWGIIGADPIGCERYACPYGAGAIRDATAGVMCFDPG